MSDGSRGEVRFRVGLGGLGFMGYWKFVPT